MMLLLVLLVFCSTGSYWITAYEIGDCGIRYNFKLTIARGKDSKPNQYPWHVGIYRRDNSSKYEYICGGSIIYDNVIITAAHCVFDENTKNIDYNRMVVAVGKHNSSWERIDESEQRFEVMDKRIPQRYKGTENMNDNDIALLALNDSIPFSDRVMPVCMDWSRTKEPYDGENCTFVGWGYEENRNLTELLQVSEMLLRNFDDCRKSVGKYFTSYLTSDKFCTISKDNSMVEKGDSGGGLVFARMQNDNDTGARYYLKGILNGREKGNDVNFLYTNVSNHMPWIRSTLDAIRDETDANKICGRRPINTTVTVNYVTRYEEYPWIATIVMSKNNKFFGIRCAGTIIHKRAVITSK
nr:chymotrypsin-like elastase family member 2A [Halyomorpha halys]